MIFCQVADITDIKVDSIVNASNALGIMGAGVAGAISRAGGPEVQSEARQVCKKRDIEAGMCFGTTPGELSQKGIKKVYHAVTMKLPGGQTGLDIVRKAMDAVLHMAITQKMKSIAFPGLGTGIGGLDKITVAALMVRVARNYMDVIDIYFVDRSQEFISEVERLVEREIGIGE